MSITKTVTLTTAPNRAATETPYKLDKEQTLKASRALIKHLKSQPAKATEKRNLLADEDDDEDASPENTVWLVLTTKKFIVDHNKLKPTRLPLPHPYIPPTGSICLIVKDPQRAIKDLIPQLPAPLNTSVQKVIGLSKLKKKYKTFESRRLLRDSYDRFLVDDRVVPSLPSILGKTFYKSSAKTPLPIKVAADVKAESLAKELNKALHSTYLRLSASASTSIRIGLKSQTPEEIAANVEAVVGKLTEKVIPNGWRNIRSIYIKGTESVALPVWLVDELFDKEKDVITPEQEKERKEKLAAIDQEKKDKKKKRKADEIARKQEQKKIKGTDGKAIAVATTVEEVLKKDEKKDETSTFEEKKEKKEKKEKARKEEPIVLAIEEKADEKKEEEEEEAEEEDKKSAEPANEKKKKEKAPKKEVKKSTYVEPPLEFAQPKKAGKGKGGKAKKSSK